MVECLDQPVPYYEATVIDIEATVVGLHAWRFGICELSLQTIQMVYDK